jgi:hypothetical protein
VVSAGSVSEETRSHLVRGSTALVQVAAIARTHRTDIG